MTSNDESKFLAWWFQPEQDKLRTHCSPNWALIIWRAALNSKQEKV